MNAPDAGRYDNLHGDEDWREPPNDFDIAEATEEIICDAELLAKHIEEDALAYPLAEIMLHVDRACKGEPDANKGVLRACHLLQKALRAEVEDAAYDLACERMGE